ncbi:response regulator transcription factor [Clostridium botulinum]|uniref:response regulator transcription factor n=1 Tax=Clostridium botulinum TaxID=1491 RepID=UPI000D13EA6E|nr:response regulator transcription factor [Clostridium botulinum]AVQ46046.1 DNA-binding response regulator [Clostridium botulinum]AVQ49664.1 DNA-binding response regulator [Clostridium botulinum]
MIKVLIADDDAFIRESLSIILDMDEEIEIEKIVENGLQAVEYCRNNKIDIALLDIRMPVMDGVEATKIISRERYGKVLILTTFDEDDYIREALHFGAKGYILKNNTPDTIIDTIKMVYKGNSVIQDVVMDKVLSSYNPDTTNAIDKDMFSKREIDVIGAISEGLSNKEISAKLFISEGTVKNYISSILSKTGLEHRTQIAIYHLKGKIK